MTIMTVMVSPMAREKARMKADWNHPYSRELAAYPVAGLRRNKYWSPVGRVDNVYGERNLMCSCGPVSEL